MDGAVAYRWHEMISGPEVALNLRREWGHGREGLSKALQARIERGRQVGAHEYLSALTRVPAFVAGLTELFEQRYDPILAPIAAGTAPKGLESTRDPAFCTIWTCAGCRPSASRSCRAPTDHPSASSSWPAPRRRTLAPHRALARR